MKKIFLLGLVLLCLPMAMAFTLTMGTHLTGIITGSHNITVFPSNLPVAETVTVNCTFFYRANDTANASFVQIGRANVTNITSASVAGINITYGFSFPELEDSNKTEIYAQCFVNGSLPTNISNTITFTLDNTKPQIISSTPTDASTDEDGDLTFTLNAHTNTSVSAELVFVGRHPGEPVYALTAGTDQYTIAFTDIPEQRYVWYASITDGLNSTRTEDMDLIIQNPASSQRRLGAAQAIASADPNIEQVGLRSFSVKPRLFSLQTFSVWGDNMINTKWGPFAPIVWIALLVVTIGGIYYYSKKK